MSHFHFSLTRKGGEGGSKAWNCNGSGRNTWPIVKPEPRKKDRSYMHGAVSDPGGGRGGREGGQGVGVATGQMDYEMVCVCGKG